MKYEYGEQPPPSAEAIAERDRLAEEMARTEAGSRERRLAEVRLVDHIREVWGMPLERFSTSSGLVFEVNDSISDVVMRAGREREARAWLKGRNAQSVARKIVHKGGNLPPEFFEPVTVELHVKIAKPKNPKDAPPQRR